MIASKLHVGNVASDSLTDLLLEQVTFEALRRSASLSLEQALELEFHAALACIRAPDFYEGVRALIIDKDNKPSWSHATLESVPASLVARYFEHDPECSLVIPTDWRSR